MEHKIILELIEKADHKNQEHLDKISARVWCYVSNCQFSSMTNQGEFFYKPQPFNRTGYHRGHKKYYASSLDAIKLIEPDYYIGDIWNDKNFSVCALIKIDDDIIDDDLNFESPELPTEHLARLHATIQAISYERGEA